VTRDPRLESGGTFPEEGAGLFVVLEGVEGAGKTTQLRLLRDRLLQAGLPVREAREPGGTALGEAVRGILLDRRELTISPESELLLMLAARAAFTRELVGPALQRGEVMLADRFESSTFAYQGYGRGLPLEAVRALNAFATGGLRPHRVLILDLPLEEGQRRQRQEGKQADRIEADGAAFHARVAEGYRALAASDPSVLLVDARPDPEQVHEAIWQLLLPLLRDRFPELHRESAGPKETPSLPV